MESPTVTLFFEGNRHLAAGDLPRAADCFRSAVAQAPDFAAAHANLGLALDRSGDSAAAEQCYRHALELGADHAEIYLNLGALLARHQQFAGAEATYRQGLLRAPRHAALWSNFGVLLACAKREDEAEQCYRTALGLDAGYANARFNLAYLLLRQQRFAEGWACLEARDWYAGLAARLSCPRWQGEDLAGKALLIGYEAGHGDMIQFCRYANVLKAKGAARIGLICYPALLPLLTTLAGVDELIAADGPLPTSGWDFWTPPLSIPFHVGTRAASIPAPIPYLAAAPDLVAQWQARLPPVGLRVGLVWRGSVQFENDAERSLHDLTLLAPLGQIPGISFVSLQKGAGEDAARCPPRACRCCTWVARCATLPMPPPSSPGSTF